MRAVLASVFALGSGCAIAWPSASAPGVFPHPDGYGASPEPHGDEARAADATCGSCHAADACAACHPSYPHAFGVDRAHPPAEDACVTCHADPRGNTVAAAACTACHPSYPHPPGWGAAGVHGKYALDRGSAGAACGNCHGGAALAGEGEAPGCASCHPSWPHVDGFDHGAAAVADPQACAGCHGASGDGGLVAVPCSSCHLGYPHPAGFATAGHLPIAAQRGERTCFVCHAPGDGPAEMAAPCGASCHGGAP